MSVGRKSRLISISQNRSVLRGLLVWRYGSILGFLRIATYSAVLPREARLAFTVGSLEASRRTTYPGLFRRPHWGFVACDGAG